MLLSKKVDVYRRQDKVILQVCTGPGGWVSAVWSYCVKSERFELNVSLHSHGLTSLGSVGLQATHVSPLFLTHDAELTSLLHSPRAILWHPSGERIAVIEGGRLFIFAVTWVSKVRRNLQEIQTTTISMKRASEIHTEREEGNAVAASEMIGVRLHLRQVSTHIGASTAALACTAFADISGTATSTSTSHQSSVPSVVSAAAHLAVASLSSSPKHPHSAVNAHVKHNGRILVGTDSGAVLSVAWGLPGDPDENNSNGDLDQSTHSARTTSTLSHTQHGFEYDTDEDEVRKRAHSYTNAGRLLATVVCPAQNISATYIAANIVGTKNSNTEDTMHTDENRDLLRIWQKPVFRLSALNNAPSNSQNAISNALLETDYLPEVLDIGDISSFGADREHNLVEVDLSICSHSIIEHSDTSEHTMKGSCSHGARVSHSAAAVREIVCSDRNKCIVIVYGDGSFSVCKLVPVVGHAGKSGSTTVQSIPTAQMTHDRHSSTAHIASAVAKSAPKPNTSSIHTFSVHISAKIHPVMLVAYPIPPTATVHSTNVSGGHSEKEALHTDLTQPDVYQLGLSGAYRSTTYTTSFDVESTLDLTPSLLQKVSRMRKLVTGRAEEEISKVLCVRLVHDSSIVQSGSGSRDTKYCMRVVALVRSRHMPALHSAQRSEVLSVARQESLSIVVYDVGLHNVDSVGAVGGSSEEGREVHCSVVQSVCIDKNITSVYATEPTLQLIHLPNIHNTHVLLHHADNRVTCRSLHDLYSVVFVVNPLLLSPSPSITTVSVCMNRILMTVWDSHTHKSTAVSDPLLVPAANAHPRTHSTHAPLYATAKAQPHHGATATTTITTTTYSRLVVVPFLTTAAGRSGSHSNLMYVDLTEGVLESIDVDAAQTTPLTTRSTITVDDPEGTDSKAIEAVNVSNNSADSSNTYDAPLLTTQLKLPRKLLSDVHHYRTLCGINNPFQTRGLYLATLEGVLVASSKQCQSAAFYPVLYTRQGVCHAGGDRSADNVSVGAEYLALVAGGSTVPYKHTFAAVNSVTTTTNTTTHSTYTTTAAAPAPATVTRRAAPLYVYNTTTHRWRSVYLTAGNRESSARLVKDIPTARSVRKNEDVTSGAKSPYSGKLARSVDTAVNRASSSNTTGLKCASVDSTHSAEHQTSPTVSSNRSVQRRNSDNNIGTASTSAANSTGISTTTASSGFSVRNMFSFGKPATANSMDHVGDNRTEFLHHHSISALITARSQLSGNPTCVLSIAWYGVHSLVLLTLRRSTYCIELLTREASKESMSVGKLQPLVHRIIMLPPGYSPSSLECIVVRSHSTGNNAAIVENVYGADHPVHTTSTIYEGDESDTDSVTSDTSDSVFTDTTGAFSLRVPTPRTLALHHNTPQSVRSEGGSTSANAGNSNTSSSGIDGCVVVVSDSTTLLSYHIQALGAYTATTSTSSKGSSKVTPSTSSASKANTLQINDYHVTELWDTNLTTVAASSTTTTTTTASLDGINIAQNGGGTKNSTNNGARSDVNNNVLRPSVQFPVKEVKVFIQNTPQHDCQLDGFQRLAKAYNAPLSTVPVFPVVSLYVLDSARNLFLVDAECGVCTFMRSNVSTVTLLRSGDVCTDRVSGEADGTTNVIGEPQLLHTCSDPAGDAQRHLLYIFTRTSLIQHIRPHALCTQHKLAQHGNSLHIPVNTLVRNRSDKSDVHAFSDTDLQRKRKRVFDIRTGSVSVQLSPTHGALIHTASCGLLVSMSTKHLNIGDFMRNRNRATHTTRSRDSVLQFVPFLCTALDHTLHSSLDCFDAPAVRVHIDNSDTHFPLHSALHTTLLQTLSVQLLHTARATTTYSALLIAYLEHIVLQYTMTPDFNYKHSQYARLTQFLYSQDPILLGEILTRLGRKLEPAVSHLLFPVTVNSSVYEDTAAPFTTSVLRLYEACLTTHHYHHAARVLSLACESIGGSESHISTLASLILALELLQVSMRCVSLRNVVECVDFCVRLEGMLVMHSRAIFGDTESPRSSRKRTSGSSSLDASNSTATSNVRTLDQSYTSTVKSKALSLIHYTRDRVYRQTQQTLRTIHTNKANNNRINEVLTPTAAASPALPFYLGMGVGWILTKAVNSLIPDSETTTTTTVGSSSVGRESSVAGSVSGGGVSVIALNVNTNTNTSNINNTNTDHSHSNNAMYTADDHLRQCMIPTAAHVHANNNTLVHTASSAMTSTSVGSSSGSVYQYSVIDTLEQKCGSEALSLMLSRTHLPPVYPSNTNCANGASGSKGGNTSTPSTTAESPTIPSDIHAGAGAGASNTSTANAGDQSPTALLLVHTLTEMFRSSTHYCNAAALLVALLQHDTTVQLLQHYLLTMQHTNSDNGGAESSEKVRRILYVYRLNKVLSRTSTSAAVQKAAGITPNTTNYTNSANSVATTTSAADIVGTLLTQRVSAQYLRRIIEADTIHYNTPHTMSNNSSHGSPRYSAVNKVNIGDTPRSSSGIGGIGSCTPGGAGTATHNNEQWPSPYAERRTGYFELTEELLLHIKCVTTARGGAGSSVGHESEGAAKATKSSTATSSVHLTILTILKCLSVGLLVTGDSAAAGILLQTILPHIARVDSRLYNVLVELPDVSSVSSVDAVRGVSGVNSGTSSTTSSSAGSGEDKNVRRGQTWALGSDQLRSLFNALVN